MDESITELSSRPERSAVEGPAVSFPGSQANSSVTCAGPSLLKPFRQQVIRNANGVGNNSQRRIDRTCRNKAGSIHNIKIIQIMGLAMRVKHAGCGIGSHAASTVLMADTLQRDTLLEISVQ